MTDDQSTVLLSDECDVMNATERQKRSFKLAAIMYVIYGAFVLTMVLSPLTLAVNVVPGVPLCLVVGPAVIVCGIVLAVWTYFRDITANAR